MGQRRRSIDRARPGGLVAGLLFAVVLTGCSMLLSNGVQVRRDGTLVTISMPGRTDPETQAWLCPRDPGPGADLGVEGDARLTAAGCLNLGISKLAGGETGWSATFDVRKLTAGGPTGFTPGGTCRLILLSGDSGSGHVTSADVPAFNIAP